MTPDVIRADGQVSRLIYLHCRLRWVQEQDFAVVSPDQSVTFFIESRVIKWIDGQRECDLRLSIPFQDGSNNNVDIIEGKKNLFRWIYENQNPTRIVGMGEVNERKILK